MNLVMKFHFKMIQLDHLNFLNILVFISLTFSSYFFFLHHLVCGVRRDDIYDYTAFITGLFLIFEGL
jgi:hypothetical protein